LIYEVLTTTGCISFIVALSCKQVPSSVVFLHFDYLLGGNLWKGELALNALNLFLSKPQIARDVSLGFSHPK
jgi:hypothetical protein